MLLQASHVASESACTLNLPQSLQSTCTRPDNNRHNRHNAPCPAGRPAQPAAWVPDNDCPSCYPHLLNGHMRCRQLHVRVRQRDICRHPRQARQAGRPDSPRSPDGQVEQCPRVSWPSRPGKVTRPRAQAPCGPARLAVIASAPLLFFLLANLSSLARYRSCSLCQCCQDLMDGRGSKARNHAVTLQCHRRNNPLEFSSHSRGFLFPVYSPCLLGSPHTVLLRTRYFIYPPGHLVV